MAESETGEKTEQATSKKKEDARKKGQMPISREVPTAALLLGAAGPHVSDKESSRFPDGGSSSATSGGGGGRHGFA